jgi:hypothetical protein
MPSIPRHSQRDQQEYNGNNRASADDEQMSHNRADHRRGEQRSCNRCRFGNQQEECGDHFQPSGEVPEPLAEADLLEHGDVHFRASQSRSASYKKHCAAVACKIRSVMVSAFYGCDSAEKATAELSDISFSFRVSFLAV